MEGESTAGERRVHGGGLLMNMVEGLRGGGRWGRGRSMRANGLMRQTKGRLGVEFEEQKEKICLGP